MHGLVTFVRAKEVEIREIINNLKSKKDDLTEREQEITELKSNIHQIRTELIKADDERLRCIKKMKECKEINEEIIKDKQFYLLKIQEQRHDLKK